MDIARFFVPFPVINTPRLVLRALRESDLDDLFRYASDPVLAEWTEWDAYASRQEAEEDLKRYLQRYGGDQLPLPPWGVQHRDSGQLIGIINIVHWWQQDRRAEIGYTIARSHWRQGFAVEAVQAMINWMFETLDIERIQATCLPENQASQQVMQKLGLQYEGLLRSFERWSHGQVDLVLYALTRVDWQKYTQVS